MVQAVDGSEVLVACVADGAGSATHADHGARWVVDAFQHAFTAAAQSEPGLAFLDGAYARQWLARVQDGLRRLADDNRLQARDYACTLLGAVIGTHAACFLQIGDGAIVIDDPAAEGRHAWVFWPQHGEFANSTFFVTMEDAADHLQVARHAAAGAAITELAMFSDGLERLILDMRSRTVHSPSLRPIFGWLAGAQPADPDKPSEVLAAYLGSANVNRRTDDDKTLVMATRAAPTPAAP